MWKTLVLLIVFFSQPALSQIAEEPTQSNRRPPVLTGQREDKQPSEVKQEEAESGDEVIRIETNLVVIPVTVVDRYGRFISNLRKEDFEIFEDDKPQKIEYFANVEQPFSVILLLDVSPSTSNKIEEIKQAAVNFINYLRSEDRVMIVAFDKEIRVLSQLTSDRSKLYRAIMKADLEESGTSLYEAVSFAISKISEFEGRKAIVLFTDGVDTTSKRAGYYDTLREAEESEALIYTIRYDTYQDMAGTYPAPTGRSPTGGRIGIVDIIGVILGGILGGSTNPAGSSAEDYEKGKRYLGELANVSSGRYFEATTNLNSAFANVAEELRRQYTLGYYPENPGQPGQRKRIRVRVQRSGVVVRAKNSYIVGQNAGFAKASERQNRVPDAQQSPKTNSQAESKKLPSEKAQQNEVRRTPVRRPPF
ncbi:MAG: VWA domain-containing protein [Pyrinomonadaceae bacterium]|nr:VWA domain-containing protein [Pyrinomonadaceae bacterium]MCX7639008.1 VWA domain-containing protein [Pyrinomonadaceae bacterium]MDW8303772.1 VWA domain-containing protein [Acidobacteriota bacterium]